MTWQSDEHDLRHASREKSDGQWTVKQIVMGLIGTLLIVGGVYGLAVWK